jgi:formylglycine-generating enzyme required for sulfatase activity
VGRYPITRAEFGAFVTSTGHKCAAGVELFIPSRSLPDGDYRLDETDRRWNRTDQASWRDPGFEQSDRHPAVCIGWNDAKAYVSWLAELTGKPYRLLTEAEWEYVARGGSSTRYWWGQSITPAYAHYDHRLGDWPQSEWKSYAIEWRMAAQAIFYNKVHKLRTREVGAFKPNHWGLFDVHGNVWEWCEDIWHED